MNGARRLSLAAFLFLLFCPLTVLPTRAQTPVQYVYDELGRLIGVVDTSGNAAVYSYDAVGNILSITRYSSTQTSIVGFSPTSGPVGTTVTITGTGFSATSSSNTVTFNGTAATITVATTTRLVVTVPSGATTGPISVTSPSGSFTTAAAFTVKTAGSGPTITSFSPSSGIAGTAVTITGTNFDTTASNDKLKLNVTRMVTGSATSTQIGTTTSPNTASGKISVQTPLGLAISSQDFYVPFGAHSTSDIGSSGRINAGGSQNVALASSGKIGLWLFDATAGQTPTIQMSGSSFASCTAYLISPTNAQLAASACSAAFMTPTLLTLGGTYTIGIEAGGAGSVTIQLTLTAAAAPPPSRPAGARLDPGHPLSTNLTGLFVMNEGTGSTAKNLTDLQIASFSGSSAPTWSTMDSSVVFAGGGSLNSYLNAGTDLNFDRLPVGQVTIVAKVYAPMVAGGSVAAAGVCEKNDGNSIDSGFVFGWDSTGALKFTVEKSGGNMRVSTTNGAVVPGQWLQVAFTWDGTLGTASAAHLFVNGVEQPKASASDGAGTVGYANATNQPFRIGNASFDFASSLKGRMAYLVVYKGRVLTTTEMGQLDTQLPINTSDFTGTIIPNGSGVTVSTTTPGQSAQLTFSGTLAERATVNLSSNTVGSVTVSLISSEGVTVASTTSASPSFSLPRSTLPAITLYRIYIHPTSTGSGSITAALSAGGGVGTIPARPAGSTLDAGNPLSTSLVGLFLMNEGTGTTDANVVNGQTASFSGAGTPTWNTADPSVVFGGGLSLNSYLNAGTGSSFDQMPTSQITVVAKVYVNSIAAAGVCEKNDGNSIDSGFVFGWDGTGAFKLTVEKSSTNMRVATATGAVTSGQWIQVAFTWDGTVGTAAAAHLFANGLEQSKASSADGSGTLGYANATNQPFRIGNASFDMAGSFNGKMAYLAVYKGRILTATEMNDLDAQLPIH